MAQQQRKTWSPFTRIVWAVLITGTAWQFPAGRVAVVAIGALVVLAVLGGLVYGLAHQGPAPKGKDPVAEYLDQQEGVKRS
jgi:hypothetical protein